MVLFIINYLYILHNTACNITIPAKQEFDQQQHFQHIEKQRVYSVKKVVLARKYVSLMQFIHIPIVTKRLRKLYKCEQ